MKFEVYVDSLPDLVGPSECYIVIVKDGVPYKVLANLSVAIETVVDTILIDTDEDPVTALPASGEIVYKKTNDSEIYATFEVSVEGQTMDQVIIDGLAAKDDFFRIKLIDTHWHRIG